MKKILLLLLCAGGFYLHGRQVFSETALTRWIGEQAALSMSGESEACAAYSEDVEVELVYDKPNSEWQVEGGKSEICGYLKQAAAALTVLQARTETSVENIQVKRSGFPWLSAELSYSTRTQVSAANIPTMVSLSDEVVTLKRGFTGLKITKLRSKGRMRAE